MHTIGDGPNQMLNNVLLLLRTSLAIFFFPLYFSRAGRYFLFLAKEKPGYRISPGLMCSSLDPTGNLVAIIQSLASKCWTQLLQTGTAWSTALDPRL